jgi:hypothetical protein
MIWSNAPPLRILADTLQPTPPDQACRLAPGPISILQHAEALKQSIQHLKPR